MTIIRLENMGRAAALALLSLLGAPGPASAEQDCTVLSTQGAMNDCAAKNYKAADAALGVTYKAVVARLAGDADALKLLKESERAWIAFRDAECTFASSSVSGGSIYPMINAECLQAQTEARTATLKSYLSCEEGDLSCPLPPQ